MKLEGPCTGWLETCCRDRWFLSVGEKEWSLQAECGAGPQLFKLLREIKSSATYPFFHHENGFVNTEMLFVTVGDCGYAAIQGFVFPSCLSSVNGDHT